MTRTFSIIALAAAAAFAQPAVAQTNQASLSYDASELATTEGAEAVYKRIKVSAKRACEVSTRLLKRDEFRCRRELEAELVEQTRSPILLALHRADVPAIRVAKAD